MDTFQRLVDRPLRRESEHLQDLPDVLRRVVDAEFPLDLLSDYLPGPQAEVELYLARVPAQPFIEL